MKWWHLGVLLMVKEFATAYLAFVILTQMIFLGGFDAFAVLIETKQSIPLLGLLVLVLYAAYFGALGLATGALMGIDK